MKTLLLALALTMPLAAADFAGKWTGTMQGKNDQGETRSQPVVIVFKMEDGKLTGHGGPDESEQHDFSNVKVDGNVVTFEVNDSPLHVRLEVDGDKMTGRVEGEHDGDKRTMDLALTRAK